MSETVQTVAESKSANRQAARPRGIVTRYGERYALLIAWLLVAVLVAVAIPGIFLRTDTLQTIFGTQSVLLVLALGLLFPLLTGLFDLSIASVLTLSAMTVALLNAQHGVPLPLAVLAGLGVGLVVGAINALLIVVFDLDSFIVTLGTSTLLLGVVQLVSQGQTVSGVDPTLTRFVTSIRVAFISLSFWGALLLCVVVWVLLTRTPLGRRLLVVGRNPEVARLSGLNTRRLRAGALIACSLLASLAGAVSVGTQGGADPTSGAAFLLPAFAAVYLGATAVTPGRFNVWGTFTAVYFLVTGITGLQLLGVPNFVQQLFYGGALVIAVGLSRLARRRSVRPTS
ncbi:ABC transporter permease [Nakamurella flava]|uniref:ABC transporter permease n=1 Tax=Nakamurella flava TaxID=2576308 RepID=A0A4U6QEI8_9ACTN|nr:ABC transporter permease [Nakamurella flava]